jgi:N6-adenosine-specific RNA methylase IME4/ParB-like chromosome segregation protein Spo0J
MARKPTTPAPPGPAEFSVTRPTGSLRAHPAAKLLPGLPKGEYQALREDIAKRGLLVPLEINAEGVVLDGHLRLRVATDLGLAEVPVRVIAPAPADEVEYVLLAAINRRHLSASQRAAMVVEFAGFEQELQTGDRRRWANLKGSSEVAALPPRGRTRDRYAATVGVSPRLLQDAWTVYKSDQELFEQIKQQKLPVDRAARQVRQHRRDAELPPTPPLPKDLFELIYADPAWRMAGNPDSSRAVENHYPTMLLDEILALQVPAADNAILFLWAVNSLLPEALAVIDAWGFTYLTNFAWVKDKIGLGQYNRCQHELLLVGRRGTFPPPPTNKRFASVINAPRGRHSEKPALVYELLEAMYPRASKLELFARGPARPGWTAWGNQSRATGR